MAYEDALYGSPEIRKNVSSLLPMQQPLLKQAVRAGKKGPGGAFGQAADYYGGLLSNDSADYNAFAAPAMRQYYEDIVPNISEQFAGMGSGGLSSSGFRNAQVQGGVDLSERLGALRAQLRQSGAQGLMNLGQIGLGNYSQNMPSQKSSGGIMEGLGKAGGSFISAFGSEAGRGSGNQWNDWINQSFKEEPNGPGDMTGANSPVYKGGNIPASPKIGGTNG